MTTKQNHIMHSLNIHRGLGLAAGIKCGDTIKINGIVWTGYDHTDTHVILVRLDTLDFLEIKK